MKKTILGYLCMALFGILIWPMPVAVADDEDLPNAVEEIIVTAPRTWQPAIGPGMSIGAVKDIMGWSSSTREMFASATVEQIKEAFEKRGLEPPTEEEIEERQQWAELVEEEAQIVFAAIMAVMDSVSDRCTDLYSAAAQAGASAVVTSIIVGTPGSPALQAALAITAAAIGLGGYAMATRQCSDLEDNSPVPILDSLPMNLSTNDLVFVTWSYENGGYIP